MFVCSRSQVCICVCVAVVTKFKSSLSLADLGVPPALRSADVSKAIRALSRLNRVITPLEKIACLQVCDLCIVTCVFACHGTPLLILLRG
jgi:hypothetical protein